VFYIYQPTEKAPQCNSNKGAQQFAHLVSPTEDAVSFADEAVVLLEIISVGVFVIILRRLVLLHHQTVGIRLRNENTKNTKNSQLNT